MDILLYLETFFFIIKQRYFPYSDHNTKFILHNLIPVDEIEIYLVLIEYVDEAKNTLTLYEKSLYCDV